MAKYTIEEETLTGIANAIREKTGETSAISPLNMPAAIMSFKAGVELPPIEGTNQYLILDDAGNLTWENKVSVTPLINTGTKLASINIGGEDVDLYYEASSVSLNGTATTSADFYAPTTAGAAGQVLTSNGSGAPGWANLPVASQTQSGIVSTGSQRFQGTKTFEYPNISSDNTAYLGFNYVNNAGVKAGEHWLGVGDKVNITKTQFYWRQYSPNSTANASTTDFYETYTLPECSVGLSSSPYYEIFTSKNYNTLDTRYLKLAGGTITGQLIISGGSNVDLTANAGRLILGSATGSHVAIDDNEIQAKSNGTTASILHINADGGQVNIGKSGQYIELIGSTKLKGGVTIQNSTYSPPLDFLPSYNNAVMGTIRYEGPYSTTADDGTVTYTNRSRFMFRTYSAGASPYTSRTSYYTTYYFPNTASGLTANQTKYVVVSGQSGYYDGKIKSTASTSKIYMTGVTAANGDMYYNSSVYTSGSVLYGACWNDYAEYRSQNEIIEPGYITYCDDDGKLKKTVERLQKYEGVVSDTFGFSIGETDDCKTPLAVSGRALVYCDPEEEHFHSGDCVCAGPDGLAYRMTREEIIEFPDRIVGVVSEIPTYETWGTGNVEVNGRIWIKVK